MKRGDVVLVRIPNASGIRGKKRPAVVVQSDDYAGKLGTVIVAEVTSNLAMAHDPACLLIEVNTPDGKMTGVLRDSVVSCLLLFTIYSDSITAVLGSLSPALVQQLDERLRVAFALK